MLNEWFMEPTGNRCQAFTGRLSPTIVIPDSPLVCLFPAFLRALSMVRNSSTPWTMWTSLMTHFSTGPAGHRHAPEMSYSRVAKQAAEV